MKNSTKTALAAVVVFALALALVASYEAFPQSTKQSSTSSQSPGNGEFAMMATDPPITASGVTQAYAHYDSAEAHRSGAGGAGSWVKLTGSGNIRLTSSADQAQTVATAKVKSGVYDKVHLNITAVTVTYNDVNYTATVASSSFTSAMATAARVNASATSRADIDLRTFIMNAGNTTKPQFVFTGTAKATTVPSSVAGSASINLGAKTDLQSGWWTQFVADTSTKVQLKSASLSQGSVQFQLQNTGGETANVRTVVITPASASTNIQVNLPASFQGSAVFTADADGSLQASNTLQAIIMTGGADANVTSGGTVNFTFGGTISLGLGITIQGSGIVSGQEYIVTVMGANTYASIVVVAG
jgi:hypothetical protein